MCEGDICKRTGVSIEDAPCRAAISFLDIPGIQEPVKRIIFDISTGMSQLPVKPGIASAFFRSGGTSTR